MRELSHSSHRTLLYCYEPSARAAKNFKSALPFKNLKPAGRHRISQLQCSTYISASFINMNKVRGLERHLKKTPKHEWEKQYQKWNNLPRGKRNNSDNNRRYFLNYFYYPFRDFRGLIWEGWRFWVLFCLFALLHWLETQIPCRREAVRVNILAWLLVFWGKPSKLAWRRIMLMFYWIRFKKLPFIRT